MEPHTEVAGDGKALEMAEGYKALSEELREIARISALIEDEVRLEWQD